METKIYPEVHVLASMLVLVCVDHDSVIQWLINDNHQAHQERHKNLPREG
jgi:hypothetical protein